MKDQIVLALDILSACHPWDFLPEQSVQNLAQSISTSSDTFRNNAGSCSEETQRQISTGLAQSKR